MLTQGPGGAPGPLGITQFHTIPTRFPLLLNLHAIYNN
jgi:hypothetical protein